ncbi:MAG: hypothetical protein ACLTKI_02935 [Lachnospiraceae bacterium]
MSGLFGGKRDFEKRIRMRIAVSVVLVIAGLAAVFLALFGSDLFGPQYSLDSWSGGFYMGTGCGLTAAGMITIIKNIRLLRNPASREQKRLEEYDERNLYLRGKTMSIASYLLIGGMYVAIVILGGIRPAVAQVLIAVEGIFVFLIFVVNTILRKIQ